MGNFSKKLSERTYLALDSLANLEVVQESGALLWIVVLMNLTQEGGKTRIRL